MKSNVTLTTLLIPAVQVGDTVAIEVDTYPAWHFRLG